RAGLMMYGQMTAGSWIYIGSQGIIQGTFETFSAAAEKSFGGDLAGKLIVSGAWAAWVALSLWLQPWRAQASLALMLILNGSRSGSRPAIAISWSTRWMRPCASSKTLYGKRKRFQ